VAFGFRPRRIYSLLHRGLLVGRHVREAATVWPVRRGTFDPFESKDKPMWYVVRSMRGAVLEVRVLPPGTHLKRTFIQAMLDYIDAGWEIAEFKSRTGVFFAQRGGDRHQVDISPTDQGPNRGRALDRPRQPPASSGR